MSVFWISIFLFILGAAFGSFGSVLVWRFMVRKGKTFGEIIKSILLGRSKCTKCNNYLGPQDLIPIFSWIFLQGKCRQCGQKISIVYLILEILSGIIFVLSFFLTKKYLGYFDLYDLIFWKNYIFFAIINWIFFLFVVGDLWFYYLIEPLWIFIFLFIIFRQLFGLGGNLYLSLEGGIIFLIAFWIIYLFGKFYVKFRFKIKNGEGFGFGDVMIAFLVGMLVPFINYTKNGDLNNILKFLLYYILLSSLSGIIFGIISIFINKLKGINRGQAIPFLPAMILARFILIFYL